MPRNGLATRVLPKLTARIRKSDILPSERKGPRLYNGKRLIKTSQSAFWRNERLQEQLRKTLFGTHDDGFWRQHVSQDVADFVDDMEAQGTKLLPEEQFALLTNPVKYFSRPQNVPGILRKQVYLPDFTVNLVYKSSDPYTAHFNIPLWFSKLDLKHYLKEVYNVDVVSVRSSIMFGRYRFSRLKRRLEREPFQKRMVVQLVKPFAWPVKPADIDRSAFPKKSFNEVLQAQKNQDVTPDYLGKRIDYEEYKSIAQQAKELLEGKEKWAPTWESHPRTKREMYGSRGSPSTGTGLPPP